MVAYQTDFKYCAHTIIRMSAAEEIEDDMHGDD